MPRRRMRTGGGVNRLSLRNQKIVRKLTARDLDRNLALGPDLDDVRAGQCPWRCQRFDSIRDVQRLPLVQTPDEIVPRLPQSEFLIVWNDCKWRSRPKLRNFIAQGYP